MFVRHQPESHGTRVCDCESSWCQHAGRTTPRDHPHLPRAGFRSLRRSVRCQSDVRYVAATPAPTAPLRSHFARCSLAPPRATFATHGRASAKCVSKQLLSQPHAPRPGLAGDADARTGRRRYRAARSSRGRARGTHWALLRCRRSCRADRGRRRRRCNCCHRRRHLR